MSTTHHWIIIGLVPVPATQPTFCLPVPSPQFLNLLVVHFFCSSLLKSFSRYIVLSLFDLPPSFLFVFFFVSLVNHFRPFTFLILSTLSRFLLTLYCSLYILFISLYIFSCSAHALFSLSDSLTALLFIYGDCQLDN